MITAGVICLLLGQSALTYVWVRVVQAYAGQPIPLVRSVPSYPARTLRFMFAGIVLIVLGLGLANSGLSPWQAGLVAAVVGASASVPVWIHNLDLRHQRVGEPLPAAD